MKNISIKYYVVRIMMQGQRSVFVNLLLFQKKLMDLQPRSSGYDKKNSVICLELTQIKLVLDFKNVFMVMQE